MKKKNFRSAIAALLAAVMVFGTAADVSAQSKVQTAETVFLDDVCAGGGLIAPEFIEIDMDDFTGTQYDAAELVNGTDTETDGVFYAAKASQIYSDDWDQYSTNYYYNLLTDDEKEYWDALDTLCLDYLRSKTDFPTYKKGEYLTDFVYTTDLTVDDALTVAQIFRYSNPQYYYLASGYSYATQGNKAGVAIMVYNAFGKGTDRAAATEKFQTAVTSWTQEVSGYATDYEKVKAIHDLICAKADYNYAALRGDNVDQKKEEQYMTQSAYSTFVMGTTVCAGYALACELLCNAVGVDSIVVTSASHGWNKVRMDDSWYNVDCTNDDQNPTIYKGFAKSNASLSDSTAYREENIWLSYIPACTLDSGSTYDAAGTLPTVTEQTASVSINAEPVYTTNQSTGLKTLSYKVTMSCDTEGASIYYTTDGTEPSVASTKAFKYKKAITVKDVTSVKAIAVSNGKLDSEVVTGEAQTVQTYTITYVLNGGENSEKNLTGYTLGDAAITLKSPTKKGYKFAGWYTSKSFDTTKVTTIETGSAGDLTLYAKWTPITYKITFKGNGATNGSMTAKSCKYGTSYKLTANKFKRKGYTFAGWNTKKNGTGKSYKNKASIKNLTTTSGKTITLYAQWKKK